MQRKIHTFIISLPKDKERRETLEKQLNELDIPFSILDAVHGASLSTEEYERSYNREKAARLFNRELSRGELGCALSHIAIYQKMVAENIPYALILEDDAKVLTDNLPATLNNLTQLYTDQAPVAVLLNRIRYNGKNGIRVDEDHLVYDAYRGFGTYGYFITRATAQILARNLYPVYVVADKWEYFQEKFVTVKALVPYVIGLSPASVSSSIDSMGGIRNRKLTNISNYKYHIRRLYGKILFEIGSRPFIKIMHQEKSKFDLL
jgi:glycosyl transferase family 25